MILRILYSQVQGVEQLDRRLSKVGALLSPQLLLKHRRAYLDRPLSPVGEDGMDLFP